MQINYFRVRLVIIIILGMIIPSKAQLGDLSKWKSVTPVSSNSPEFKKTLRLENDFVVEPGYNGVLIRNYDIINKIPEAEKAKGKVFIDPSRGTLFTWPVNDGLVVAYSMGEWGGSVWFHSRGDGKLGHRMGEQNIAGFLEHDGKVFAFSNSIESDKGCVVYELVNDGEKWTMRPVITLPDTVYAYCKTAKQSFVLAMGSMLLELVIADQLEFRILVKDAPWFTLSPNSIVSISEDEFYVGCHSVICKVKRESKTSFETTWLLPAVK